MKLTVLSIKIQILLITMGLMFLYGCTEKIDIKLDDTYTRLVVDGAVTNDSIRHWVKLSLTSSYFYNQSEPMVSGANVVLTDGFSTWNMAEDPIKKGYYYTPLAFKGVVGRNYSLHIDQVQIANENKTFDASCVLAPNGRLDSIAVEKFTYGSWNAWIIKLYAQDPPDTANFYMFNVYKNGVLITDTIKNVEISNDILFDGNYTNGIQVQFIEKEKANPGDTLTLEMAGISKEYFNFVQSLKTEAQGSNPMFGGPPANVVGNVSNGGLGFFAAYSVARASAIVPSGKKSGKVPLSNSMKKNILKRQ